MSPRMQTKLLRFLNDGTFRRVGEDHEVHVDVRVICATQKNLVELVQKGLFREDLYYRLNVLTLYLPPLRDCPQDIMPLTELFVARFADEQGIPRPKLSADLNSVLTRYSWPVASPARVNWPGGLASRIPPSPINFASTA